QTSICRTATWKCASSRRFTLPSLDDNGESVRTALDERFRLGHARLIAALTRRFGAEQLASIENAVQEAYVRALRQWPDDGLPESPERWLARVAHNAMVDMLRRDSHAEPL